MEDSPHRQEMKERKRKGLESDNPFQVPLSPRQWPKDFLLGPPSLSFYNFLIAPCWRPNSKTQTFTKHLKFKPTASDCKGHIPPKLLRQWFVIPIADVHSTKLYLISHVLPIPQNALKDQIHVPKEYLMAEK
jgi:hypothetical protein